MEADKYISTSSATTAKIQLTINDLDDDSLGMIFNKLPYIDRMRIDRVCQRWYAISEANWCTYSKHLAIDEDFLTSFGNTTETDILDKILQRSGPYLEEVTFEWCMPQKFPMGTVEWVAKLCPKLKRLNPGALTLKKDDLLACRNLEALVLYFTKYNDDHFEAVFRNQKRLRRLEIIQLLELTPSDFDYLDPGQLEFLRIECCRDFEFTAAIADKLAESLVDLRYSTLENILPKLEYLGKLKNLRNLDLKFSIARLKIEFIADIVKNFRKLEYLFLSIASTHAYDQNAYEPLFDLPYLRKLVIILETHEMARKERVRLIQRASHLEFFVIDSCPCCGYNSSVVSSCSHRSRWLS